MLKKALKTSIYIFLSYLIISTLIIKFSNLNSIDNNKLLFVSNDRANYTPASNSSNINIDSDYIGSLYIPKINLKKSLYDINSSKNNIEENVTILKGSILPNDNNNSIIFLAAHSGSGKRAFFDRLKELKKDDFVYLEYNNKLYQYIIEKTTEVEKNGYISGSRKNPNEIVLTTCSDNPNKQLIIYGILKNTTVN